MRIKSVDLLKFGIFDNYLLHLSPGFTLIYGDNEKGKTTVLDGILVGLFAKLDKRSGQIKNIPLEQKRRYGEDFAIKVITEDDGKEITFPAYKNFEDVFGLKLMDILSIFIVREGELKLAEKKDFGRWWDSLKAKLLGFEEMPESVLRKIAQTAELTDGLALPRHISTKVAADQEKLNWFKNNEHRIKELRTQVRELEELKQKENTLSQELEEKRKGQKKTALLKAKVLYEDLENKRKKVREEYERYLEEDGERWEKLEKELTDINKEMKFSQDQLIDRKNSKKQKQEEIERLNNTITNLTQKLHILEAEEHRLDQALRLKDDLQRAWHVPSFAPWMTWGLTIFALTLGVTFSSVFLYILAVFLLLISTTLTLFFLKQLKKQKRLQELTTTLIDIAKNTGLGGQSLEELRENIRTFRAERNEKLTILNRIKEEELPGIKREIEKLEKNKEAAERKSEEISHSIRDLCFRTGLSSLSQLKEKLQEKKDLMTDIEKRLKPNLHQLLKANESDWATRLKELEQLKEVEPFEDESELDRIHRQREDCRYKREQIHAEIIRLEEALQNKFGCRRTEEVYWKIEEIQKEIDNAEVLKKAGVKVKQIFEHLLAASDDILREVITQGKASEYFRAFTGGNYSSVELLDYSLRAKDNMGHTRGFEDLSTATKDQLLTAIRLALAEKLLRLKGFLIFDEAFVTSDRKRLGQQMRLLADLTRQGWQIIYLTAKEDAKQEAERLQQIDVEMKVVSL